MVSQHVHLTVAVFNWFSIFYKCVFLKVIFRVAPCKLSVIFSYRFGYSSRKQMNLLNELNKSKCAHIIQNYFLHSCCEGMMMTSKPNDNTHRTYHVYIWVTSMLIRNLLSFTDSIKTYICAISVHVSKLWFYK